MNSVSADNPWPALQVQIEELQQLYRCPPQRSVLLNQSHILFDTLKELFQNQILAQIESLTFPGEARPYVTEMHRQLRLLSTDLSFFEAAKTDLSQQQRFGQIEDRLRQLQDYSVAIVKALAKAAETKASPESPQP